MHYQWKLNWRKWLLRSVDVQCDTACTAQALPAVNQQGGEQTFSNRIYEQQLQMPLHS